MVAVKKKATSEKRAKKIVGPYEKYKGRDIPEPRLKRPTVRAGLKAICWNVGGLRAFLAKRSRVLKKLVQQEKPAILGILEHKLQEGEQVDDAVQSLKKVLPQYTAAKFSCSKQKKGYSGVAVLLRDDVFQSAKVSAVKLERGPDEGRTVCVELPKLFVVVCYVVNSGDGLKRLQERIGSWDPQLRNHVKGLARKKPVLLLGDMNVAHRDVDIWNLEAPHVPKSSATTPEERDSFGKLLEAGFVDGFAHKHPEAMGAFTYWSVRAKNRKPNRGLRLDYALASRSLVEGKAGKVLLADAFHLPAFAPGGDHCPVGATIEGA